MSKHFIQSDALRDTLLKAYRAYARAQLWRRGPRILLNSIPKAGTHLLGAELERIPGLQSSRFHIIAHEVNAASEEGERIHEFKLDVDKVRKQIGTVRGSQFFTAHLFWYPELEDLLAELDIKTIFMVRDPRDILVSKYHYIMGLKRHHLHDFLARGFATEEERYRELILGREDGPPMRSMALSLRWFLPWTRSPKTITIRFEDLVGERGGGSAEAKLTALERIRVHCGLGQVGDMERLATTNPGATVTLRKGEVDAWRHSLPEETIELIARECGDMIEEFGYSAR